MNKQIKVICTYHHSFNNWTWGDPLLKKLILCHEYSLRKTEIRTSEVSKGFNESNQSWKGVVGSLQQNMCTLYQSNETRYM